MIHKLRKIAAKICLHYCFIDPNDYSTLTHEYATDLITSLLVDNLYEVRIFSLKFLIQYLSNHKNWDQPSFFDHHTIQMLLLKRLGISFLLLNQPLIQSSSISVLEDNPKCISYILRLLGSLHVLLPAEVFRTFFTSKNDSDDDKNNSISQSNDLWKKLNEWAHSKTSIMKEEGIFFMGMYIHQFCEYLKRLQSFDRTLHTTKVIAMFNEWLALCNQYSAESQVSRC
jgi:hypothetical protein